MVPDLLVSKAQHSDSVFQKVFNFYFPILPPEPLMSASLPNSAISQRTGRHQQRCSEHLHIPGDLVPIMVTDRGWLSEMCVLTLALGAFSRQSLARMQNI